MSVLMTLGVARIALLFMLIAWWLPVRAQGLPPDVAQKAALCAACHGANGIPAEANVPLLWGQNEGYIYLQLKDLKNGVRANPVMSPIAQMLSREDMLALAAYFAEKPWPNLSLPAAAPETAQRALTVNTSIGCTGCHLANYQGNSTVPRLAGQKPAYLLQAMLAFRSRERANNPGMSDLMNAASPDDLAALAAYISGL